MRDKDKKTIWRKSNPDSVRLSQAKASAKRKLNGKNLSYQRERRHTPEGYVDRFLERARIRTEDTDLTRDFFNDKMKTCAFSGKGFVFKNHYDCYHNPKAPSIDRIDSKIGYYKDNVQVIWSCLNRMKNDLPPEDFDAIWKELTQ